MEPKFTIDNFPGLPPDPTTKSGVPKHVADSLARIFLPDIIAFYQTEEGRREFRDWEEEQKLLELANDKEESD